jgi:flagellar biosynthesis protein FliR
MIIHLDNIFSLMLIFVRTMALFICVPVLGGSSIPVFVRVGLGMLVSAILLPIAPAVSMAGADFSALLVAMLYEFMVGLMMGMTVTAIMSSIAFATDSITNEIGLMRVENFDPTSDMAQGGGIDTMIFYFSLVVFMAMGMHREVILALAQSFQALPAGCLVTKGMSIEALTHVTSQIFVIGILMSAPFIAVNFMVNTVFSILGKVAPKMNVFFVSFPIRIMIGLAVLASTVTLLAHYIESEYSMIPSRMSELILGR